MGWYSVPLGISAPPKKQLSQPFEPNVCFFQVCPGLQKVTLLKRCVRCAIDVSRNSPGL